MSAEPESTAMTVVRVPTEHGTRPEPPCDPAWSDLRRLRWLAGLISHDTGIPLTVHVSKPGAWRQPTTYEYTCPGRGKAWGDGGRTVRELEVELRGFESGVRAQRYSAEAAAESWR